MFKTLRTQFIFSHILPLLIVIPLMGLLIIYMIESRFLIPSMLSELENNALLLGKLIGQNDLLWNDVDYANELLKEVPITNQGNLMLLDRNGFVIASSNSDRNDQLGMHFDLSGLYDLTQDENTVTVRYRKNLDGEIADAFAPVLNPNKELLGYIRLSYQYVTFSDQLYQLRYLLSGILLISLILGAGIGILLAINVGNPLRQVTQAVYALANGERNEPLPEKGAMETRRLSSAVNVLMDRLRGFEAARKRLLANLVHEIGRPLGALRMGIEALSHGAQHDPDFFAELLTGMDQETRRLQKLLDDLASLHEQVLGVLELDYEEINLNVWMPQMLAPWEQVAAKKRINWTLNLTQPSLILQADPLRLAQIIGNLVSNAIKFTPSGGSISVEVGAENEWISIKVNDNGPGIPSSEQENIFVPFMRGGQGKRFPQGMGLGLSIVRDLVDAHGGKIMLESDSASGTTFEVWLRKSPKIKI